MRRWRVSRRARGKGLEVLPGFIAISPSDVGVGDDVANPALCAAHALLHAISFAGCGLAFNKIRPCGDYLISRPSRSRLCASHARILLFAHLSGCPLCCFVTRSATCWALLMPATRADHCAYCSLPSATAGSSSLRLGKTTSQLLASRSKEA